MLARRLIDKRNSYLEGPRSAWDTVTIDHLPGDHWIRRRMRYSVVRRYFEDSWRLIGWYDAPWFHNEYNHF